MRIPERIQNFRDLGGIVNMEGRTVKHGLLLRSAALVQASDQDIELLEKEYKVRTVVDFRSDHEVMLSPDRDIPGSINVHLPMIDSNGNVWRDIMGDAIDGDPLEMLVKRAGTPLVQQLARDMYVDLTMKPMAQGQYARFMRLILDTTDGAVLWHCSQGKDRTGVGAALILAALGCGQEDIVNDYDISNIHYAKQVDGFIKNMNVTDPDSIMVIRTFVGANTDYFRQALDTMAKEYGSLYGYVRDCLGLTEQEIQTLRDRYLE